MRRTDAEARNATRRALLILGVSAALAASLACGPLGAIPPGLPQPELPSGLATAAPGAIPSETPADAGSAVTTLQATLVRVIAHVPPENPEAIVSLSGAAFSPDGASLATAGGTDDLVKIWDWASGSELRTLAGHTGAVSAVAYSPDGKYVASGSWDSTAKLWDAATGQDLHTLTGHTDSVFALDFSPDGSLLITGSLDQAVDVRDAATGSLVTSLSAGQSVLTVAFAPDGKTIAAGTGSGAVVIWDATSWQVRRTLDRGDLNRVTSLSYSSDGARLAAASGTSVTVWDIATGETAATWTFEFGATSVAYSPDGGMLAIGVRDAVLVLDAADGQQQATLTDPAAQGDPVGLAFTPDGKTVAAVFGSNVLVWNLTR